MDKQQYLILDYETRSELDLKKVGASEYSLHPSTRILCVGWKYGTKSELKTKIARVWSPAYNGDYGEFIKGMLNPEVKLVAHNSMFEQLITKNVLLKILSSRRGLADIPISRWICTSSLTSALALPRSLEGACQVLGLSVQKDMEGRKLILKYCKPRKATKNNSNKWHNRLSDLRRIAEYCRSDIEATAELFLSIPELGPTERKIWELDQEINHRGYLVDRPLIQKILDLIDEEILELNREIRELTNGIIRTAGQRNALLNRLNLQGAGLKDLKAKTIEEWFKSCSGQVRIFNETNKRLLEIRQAVSKTSTAKYEAFERYSKTDGRCRDGLMYHGATTGRWTGKGVQVQNFPRGTLKDTAYACDLIKENDLEMLRLIYGEPMTLFSNCLRSMIISTSGKKLYCADYASIETRILFWLSKHEKGLNAYKEKRDLYREMALVIFNKKHIESVTKDEREVGKRSILGCGYGMGWKKFFETCQLFGQGVTEDIAQSAVSSYREIHYPVPALWKTIERAAIYAVDHPSKKVRVNYVSWFMKNKFLHCELPSGRRLSYYKPEVRYESQFKSSEKLPKLYHEGVNPVSRKWELSGTYGGKLVENIIQAVARDVMAHAMLWLNGAGYEILLSVHDELLAEKKNGDLTEFETCMKTNPIWASGLPLEVEGWTGLRYGKK